MLKWEESVSWATGLSGTHTVTHTHEHDRGVVDEVDARYETVDKSKRNKAIF